MRRTSRRLAGSQKRNNKITMLLALLLRFFVAAACLAVGSRADEAFGCVDPNNPDSPELVKIGQRHTICLTLGNSMNWSNGVKYMRYTFRPKADEYSKFHIPKSYSQLIDEEGFKGQEVAVSVASQDKFSFLSQYYGVSAAGDFDVFPFLTAIIDVKEGKVQGIAWDDACVFCPKDTCKENIYNYNGEKSENPPNKSCFFTQEECNKISKDEPTCDITLYVVWTGTDVDGRAFQSSGYRFSAFPPASLKDRLMNLIPNLPWTRR